jgi:hypothetical protein
MVILFGLFVALDLNRRAQAGRLVGQDQETLTNEYDREVKRQVELEATLEYVRSEEYVAVYAREEGGYLKQGERRIVTLLIDAKPDLPSDMESATDAAHYARPWQAWWQLITDQPMPTEQ